MQKKRVQVRMAGVQMRASCRPRQKQHMFPQLPMLLQGEQLHRDVSVLEGRKRAQGHDLDEVGAGGGTVHNCLMSAFSHTCAEGDQSVHRARPG